jgi:hypothetical protein
MMMLAYGGGTNSTALLIELMHRGYHIDYVLFSDTGGERPDTYRHVERMDAWLKKKGHPGITTVRYTTEDGKVQTLEEDCHRYRRMPSLVYGFKGCSQKYKRQPQEKFMNNRSEVKDFWKEGGKVTKVLGYDADEPHRAKFDEDKKYKFWYPLIEWDMGRPECVEVIRKEGLSQPGKSACFFCPATTWKEVKQLNDCYPDLVERAIAIEESAKENMTSVKGLARHHSWKDMLAMEKAQLKMFHVPTSCDCYDGD